MIHDITTFNWRWSSQIAIVIICRWLVFIICVFNNKWLTTNESEQQFASYQLICRIMVKDLPVAEHSQLLMKRQPHTQLIIRKQTLSLMHIKPMDGYKWIARVLFGSLWTAHNKQVQCNCSERHYCMMLWNNLIHNRFDIVHASSSYSI